MDDDGWAIRRPEWQIKCVRSVGRPQCHWRDDIVGQKGAIWTRTEKDRGLLSAVEGHGLESNKIQ